MITRQLAITKRLSRKQMQCASLYSLVFKIVMCWILSTWVALSVAQPAPAANEYPKKINFRNIMQNQDIAIGEVEAIIQDHEGFMWLGGRNALLRFDGFEFLSIQVANPDDLSPQGPVTQVLELLEDSHHNLWAATRSGLYKYDRDREIMLPLKNAQGAGIFREIVYALAESPDGELLIGSGFGLHFFNTQTLAVRNMNDQPGIPKSLPSNIISDLFLDKNNMLWIGMVEGIVRLDLATMETKLFEPDPANSKSMTSNSIRTIVADHKGFVWAGSDNGVYRLEPDTGAIRIYRHNPTDPHTIPDNITRQIFVDQKGWIWTGSDGGGISLYDDANDHFLRFSHQAGERGTLSSNSIRCIYEDNIGDLWIGTYPSGVNVYDRSTSAIRKFALSSDPKRGLPGENVEAIEENADGTLWVGANGVTLFDPETEIFTHYPHTDGSDSRSDSSSFLNGVVDSDGEIRFGSWSHGILRYNPEKDRFDELPTDTTLIKRGEKTSTLLNDKMIWDVYEDRQKTLWISTHYNGLTKFDKKTGLYTFYPYDPANPDSVSASLVWTTYEDSAGRFWVGTAYGLNLMDRERGTFKRYIGNPEKPRSLANNSILSIYEDKQRRLWLGTDGGLHLYHPETDDFTVYNTKDGFVDPGIRSITEDQQGNLWLGTNNGIVMFNPDSKLVRNYTRYNGDLIGGAATGAAITTRSGEIAIGTRSGLYLINANKLLINEKAPPVVLTDFRIFTEKIPVNGPEKILNKVINQTDKITLDHTKSMISFHFAALNFRDADKNEYAYKLVGFDDQWRTVGNQRSALYTNLPAGTYQFHVKASNNDGIWNDQGHSIQLVILPPPWKTWWAYTIYAGVLAGMLLLFVRNQHKKVAVARNISRELEQKVAERTTELRNKNAELENAYAQLEAISLSDPLTGLSNRRYLQKLMPMDTAKVQREYNATFSKEPRKKPTPDLTFYILDVDHFKSVNDIYGHNAGDQLLIQLSNLLTQTCRESDCVVRWGGEEFLIVSRFADREDAPLMAERIRKTIADHVFTLPDGSDLKKTCSIGFACFPFLREAPMALSWEQVVNVADHALYAAKRSGRNRSVGLIASELTPIQGLHQEISHNLKGMVQNNELAVIAPDKENLIWE
jgi:diguanylate cyclase (GGDEF)-like protein